MTTDTTPRHLPRHPTFWIAVVVVAAFAVYLQFVWISPTTHIWGLFQNQADLRVYRAGALRVTHGVAIYDRPVLGRFEYTYPPFAAVVMRPLAWMSRDVAVGVWSALIFLALAWVIWACFRARGYRRSWRLAALTVTVGLMTLLFEPVRTTLWYGQINVFLMTLVVWDVLRADRWRLGGVGVGLAAGIKLTPAFFVLEFLVTRRWRAAVVAMLTIVGTVVVAVLVIPRQSWLFFSDKVFDSGRVGDVANPADQSLRGALALILHTNHPSTPIWMAAALVAAVLGLGAAWCAHRMGNEVLAIAVTGMTTAAVSPFSWGHHWVWFVPLAVVIVDAVLRSVRRRAPIGVVAATVALVALVASVFLWKYYLPEGANGVRPFYGIGVFMNPVPSWFRWFAAQPYLWVFAVASVTTIALYLLDRRRITSSPDTTAGVRVPDGVGRPNDVGGRR